MYKYNPSILSNYKVCILFKPNVEGVSFVSTTNHHTFQSACEEMHLLGLSCFKDMEYSGGKTWKNILNIWVE